MCDCKLGTWQAQTIALPCLDYLVYVHGDSPLLPHTCSGGELAIGVGQHTQLGKRGPQGQPAAEQGVTIQARCKATVEAGLERGQRKCAVARGTVRSGVLTAESADTVRAGGERAAGPVPYPTPSNEECADSGVTPRDRIEEPGTPILEERIRRHTSGPHTHPAQQRERHEHTGGTFSPVEQPQPPQSSAATRHMPGGQNGQRCYAREVESRSAVCTRITSGHSLP